MEALENKLGYNRSIIMGVFSVIVAVSLAIGVMLGSTVTSIAASPMDPTNSTDTNQTEAGQISSSKTGHETPMNSVRNMK